MSEAAERGWIVKLGLCAVPFRTQQAADQFVERLKQRLEAPHWLPGEPQDRHQTVTQELQHHS
ncbi:hypothetical protein [Pseudomonas sp. BMS12]|uniref:hypothetical protein n=1 Tax=Pseudomonas sp. BMS12 TaxID=1796033 RepID=UPI001F2C5D79|nr:hypothetical protein [Pseudomonas sp. BMS12]